jgi:hypothetical protein
MTRKTAKGAKPAAKKTKRLSLKKQTVKDLAPRGAGAKGGKWATEQTMVCTVGCRTLVYCPVTK